MKKLSFVALTIMCYMCLIDFNVSAQTTWWANAVDPSPTWRLGPVMVGAIAAPLGSQLHVGGLTPNSHINVSGTGPTIKFSDGYTSNGKFVMGLATSTNQFFTPTVANDFSMINTTTTSPGSLIFGTSNVERFRIASNGNVGIGFSSPTAKLDVNGVVKATGFYMATGASLNRVLVSDAVGNASWSLLGPTNVNAWQATGNASGALDFIGTTNTNPLIFKTNSVETMRITSAGNIGIGDNATLNRLSIIGTDANDKNFIKLKNSSSTASSSVGICLNAGLTTAIPSLNYTAPSYTAIAGWADVLSLNNNGNGGVSLNSSSPTGLIRMYTNVDGSNNPVERMRITSDGNIGIGIVNPAAKLVVNGTVSIGTNNNYVPADYMLAVNGKIIATEIAVKLRSAWGDFCFAPEFELMKLSEVEAYIKKHQHLPGVLSAKEIAANGLELGEMENILMQKIEQLTLYAIEQEKIIAEQKQKDIEHQSKVDQLIKLLEAQNARIEKLEQK